MPCLFSSSLNSNWTCTPTKRHPQAQTKNASPKVLPTIPWIRPFNPSIPIAKPTRLAIIIMRMFPTAPIPQSTRYRFGRSLHFPGGNNNVAMISGNTKRVMSQPHISRRKLISCHSATKVKTARKLMIDLIFPKSPEELLPPRGT